MWVWQDRRLMKQYQLKRVKHQDELIWSAHPLRTVMTLLGGLALICCLGTSSCGGTPEEIIQEAPEQNKLSPQTPKSKSTNPSVTSKQVVMPTPEVELLDYMSEAEQAQILTNRNMAPAQFRDLISRSNLWHYVRAADAATNQYARAKLDDQELVSDDAGPARERNAIKGRITPLQHRTAALTDSSPKKKGEDEMFVSQPLGKPAPATEPSQKATNAKSVSQTSSQVLDSVTSEKEPPGDPFAVFDLTGQVATLAVLGILMLLCAAALTVLRLGSRSRTSTSAQAKEQSELTSGERKSRLRIVPGFKETAAVSETVSVSSADLALADLMEEIFTLGQGLRTSIKRAKQRLELVEQVLPRNEQAELEVVTSVLYAKTILDTLHDHLKDANSLLNFPSPDAFTKVHAMLKNKLVIRHGSPQTVRLSDGRSSRTPVDWIVLVNSLLLRAEQRLLAVDQRRA